MSSTLIGKDIMDFENEKDKNLRILERNYSVGLGCSSRMSYYYQGSGEGVPFKWEMHPGTAKDPPKEELLPPLSPPPALLSLGLPKPSFQDTKPSRSRLRFWKKITKSGKAKKLQEDCSSRDDDAKDYADIFQRLD